MFSTAVRECFQNDRKHYYEGMKYNIIEAQQIMGSYFGYSAYGFRVKRMHGPDMCLTADLERKTLEYQKCEMIDGRVSFKDSQLFYFAKHDAKTQVNLKNGRQHIYKDYLTHIIPQKSLNSWLLDKDWKETNKELLCVGLDYKPLNSMSMSKKDFDYKLKECGSKNFLSVFLNLPSSYEGDDLLNDKNKRSSLLLMGKKNNVWTPFNFDGSMNLSLSTFHP